MKVKGEGKIKEKIFSFSKISALLFFVLVITGFFNTSCTKINEFTVGENFIDSQTSLRIVDTFRIDLSTIMFDSVATSGAGIAFIGNQKDDSFGSIESESYFDFAYQSFSDVEENAVYDSAAFLLIGSGAYYGDTTSAMTISVHQLTEPIELFTNGYLYNNTSFDYSPDVLGTATFYPRPNSKSEESDTLVRIPVNSFGETLYNLIDTRDEIIKSEDWFDDYIKGFVLKSASADNNAIIGFKAKASSLVFKIYYHLDKVESVEKEISISMGEESYQFNHVIQDLSGTPLALLKDNKYELDASETGGRIYMQGLTGLFAKFRFPSLQDLKLNERWNILRAELVIEPEKNTYDEFPLPKKLYLYETDRLNRITSTIKDKDGNAQIGTFHIDDLYDETTGYTFDITSYINNELYDGLFDYNHGLLLGLDQDQMRSDMGRLIIGGKKHVVKLQVYYLSY